FEREENFLSKAVSVLQEHPGIVHATGLLAGEDGFSQIKASKDSRFSNFGEGDPPLQNFMKALGECAVLTGKTQGLFDIRNTLHGHRILSRLNEAPPGSALSVPLKVDGRVIGAFCVFHPDPYAFGRHQQNALELFARLSEQLLVHHRLLSETTDNSMNWENCFRTLTDRLDLAVTVMKADHSVQFCRSSKSLEDLHPCRPVPGQKCERLVGGHQSPCPLCPGELALGSGQAEMLDVVSEDIIGRRVTTRLRAFPVLDASGRAGSFIQTAESLNTKGTEVKTDRHLAYFDSLTDLPNRTLFLDRLKQAQARAKREGNILGLLILDLDRFKGINDSFNHAIGDRLLKAVARRLKKTIRQTDTIARLGSDEFAIMLTTLNTESQISAVTRKLQASLRNPFQINNRDVFVSASIGIGIAPTDGTDSDTLLKHAGMALKTAKSRSPGSFIFFSSEMNRYATENSHLETHMRHGLAHDEFSLVYQPQVDHVSNKVIGVEALLRWNHPEKGSIPPSRFIPLAEETGFIQPLGEWVLREACRQNRAWQEAGHDPLPVSVNISGVQIKNPDLIPLIDNILTETGLETRFLELELTESVLMEDTEASIATLDALKSRGIRLAIDDFGTGYSSLSYLKRLPIDRIKIDQTFVNDITCAQNQAPIVEAIIAMARSLQLGIIAEGVETQIQLDFLKKRKCREMQGFYFGKPICAERFAGYLGPTGAAFSL
ncbi:MAG TPA: bifunctional diguanylate cyclase/phosphodiesterase, partial [Desulfuromonadales bacterium]|nr:bifunctional diguanylate cyclase/phosphodiesterase [Desulfuromonadales bacterium]